MLPKIEHPTTMIEIPSTKQKVPFRNFLVKEEKIMLMAKAGEDKNAIFLAIKQIVNNCCLSKDFNIDNIAIFDLEYIFLQLRIISVNSIVELSFIDKEDNKTYDFKIDLTTVNLVYPEKKLSDIIKINDKLNIKMKYPQTSIYNDIEKLDDKNYFFDIIVRCVDCVFDDETVYKASDYTIEEMSKFLEDLGTIVYDNIKEYILNIPKLYHVIEYENSMGTKQKIEFDSVFDFFPF